MELHSVENHPSIRMTRFYMQMVGMWYVEKKRDKIVSNVVLVYTIVTMLIALVVMGTDFRYSWGNFNAVCYNAPCTITVMLELLKLLMFVYNRQNVMDLNAFTENTFWKVKYKSVDLVILNRCNELTMRMNVVLAIFMQIIAWHYISIPIVESVGKNNSERILPFKMWFNLPFEESPYYEVAFTLQAAATLSVSICATTFASFLFTICIYATGQFKILQRRLEICCNKHAKNVPELLNSKNTDRVTYNDLKSCIKQHQLLIGYMDRVESLYCYIMLGVTLSAVLQICFSGFQVVLVRISCVISMHPLMKNFKIFREITNFSNSIDQKGVQESIQRTVLSLEFLGGSIILLYLFAWACHAIIEESTAVAEAACRASWYTLSYYKWGKAYRIAILMLVARARRPCIVTVGKFTAMSLETFMSVFSTSLSYFTILKQISEESA